LTDILVLKILVFALFVVVILWIFVLLRRTPDSEEGPEVYTVKDGRVQVHTLKKWREVQKNANQE
jgi:hypothetical protein